MKEIRPSTWVLLGVMALIIFAPLFLLDIDPIQQMEPANSLPNGPGNGIRPSNPRPSNTPGANRPADNPPMNPETPPASNKPGDRAVD